MLPAVVAHHCAPHKLVPALVVLNSPQSAANSVLHIRGVVILERKTVAVVVGRIEYRVLKTANLANYGDSAVAQSDHLSEAAGLLSRRHKEDVGA